MTGGGGGYYVPPVRRRVSVSCEMLEVITVLVQPNEELIATLNVGQVLTVNVKERIIYAMYGDKIVGNIETPENSKIIECIAAGTLYLADIQIIEGTRCEVKIHALQL